MPPAPKGRGHIRDSVVALPDHGQAATEPAFTPWQSVAESVQPARVLNQAEIDSLLGFDDEQDEGYRKLIDRLGLRK